MYIRRKIIRGKEYWYLCKSVREGSKVRQKVIKYLGTMKPTIMDERGFDWATGKNVTRQILDNQKGVEIEVKDGKLILKEGVE